MSHGRDDIHTGIHTDATMYTYLSGENDATKRVERVGRRRGKEGREGIMGERETRRWVNLKETSR